MPTPEYKKITKDSVVTLVEMQATDGGKLGGKRVKDIYAGLRFPSRAIDGLKEVLIKQYGWTNVVTINPRFNANPGQLSESDWTRIRQTDVLGLSIISRTADPSEELANAYKKEVPDGIVLAGGNHATFAANECSKWAVVVRKEGEVTLPKVLEAFIENGSPKGVQGVTYRDGDEIINEPNRPLLTEAQMEKVPWPDYDALVDKRLNGVVINASRGCNHACDFCSEHEMNEGTYRRISNEAIMARLRKLCNGPVKRIFWGDDNAAGYPKQAEELLRWIADEKMNVGRRYVMQLHAEIGLRKGFPELLRKAGVFVVTLGLESINEAALVALGKASKRDINMNGTDAIREEGVGVHGMFIAGADGDTEETLLYQLEWAKRHVDTLQIFTPGPLPGTKFTRAMEEQGRILRKGVNYLMDGQSVLVRSKDIAPYDLHVRVDKMYADFYSFKLLKDSAKHVFYGPGVSFSQRLADFKWDLAVRAYAWHARRSILGMKQTQEHAEFLKTHNWRYQ